MNAIQRLFNIRYPIIQAGMVWCSGWKLASAISKAGGLGLIGGGSMHPETLRAHIIKCQENGSIHFGVNVPLLYPNVSELMDIIIQEQIKVVFTSGGSPATWTSFLKDKGITVAHVVSSTRFAAKAQACGVDVVVAEGFEAGGHNGKEETTTLCLVPMVREAVDIPVIAAGGIANGRSMLAAMALGADGVQIGSAFAIANESSAHVHFKEAIKKAQEGDTTLCMREISPVRLLKNLFYHDIEKAEKQGASREDLKALVAGRAKLGIFLGDIQNGKLEIGQVSAALQSIQPAAAILQRIWQEFLDEKVRICKLDL